MVQHCFRTANVGKKILLSLLRGFRNVLDSFLSGVVKVLEFLFEPYHSNFSWALFKVAISILNWCALTLLIVFLVNLPYLFSTLNILGSPYSIPYLYAVALAAVSYAIFIGLLTAVVRIVESLEAIKRKS